MDTLVRRERFRTEYWSRKDPIASERLLWRAQTLRHLVHLLPGESILELGCGDGSFTRQLLKVSRGGNPITAATFQESSSCDFPKSARHVHLEDLPGALGESQFDYIVAMDLLDRSNSGWLLQHIFRFLKPGGRVIFYETNPWNPVLKMKRAASGLTGNSDPRNLLLRPEMNELISEIGYIRVFSIYNDFVYWPLTRRLAWLLRNLSILLENMPVVRTLSGSILIHAQKPPKSVARPNVSLCEHDMFNNAVSVVVPCHNEESNIGPLVNGLQKFFGAYLHEIVLVDDNSTDGTCGVLERLSHDNALIKPIFRSPPNGVGRALSDGLKAATGDWVLTLDCDFQHLLPELRDLFDAGNEGYDVAIGSRFSRHSVLLNYPFNKILANRGFHALAKLVLGRKLRDVTNNLKLFRREIVERMHLVQPGFAVNAETGLQPILMGYQVKECLISWINRTPDMGSSSFRLIRVGGGYWQVLWKLWLSQRFSKGEYRLPLAGVYEANRGSPHRTIPSGLSTSTRQIDA